MYRVNRHCCRSFQRLLGWAAGTMPVMKGLTWTLVIAALAAIAACTGQVAQPGVSVGQTGDSAGPATVQPGGRPTQANQPLATSTGFVMCSLVPAGDVQSRTPFTIPLKDAVPTSDSPQGCLYSFSGDRDLASVLLTVTDFDSPADALTALHDKEQTFRDNLSLEPQSVAGVGDEAAAFPGGDEVGVEAVVANRVVDANLKGQFPDVGDAQKVPAATELAKLIIARLP
jgi:hypothetical protein